MDLRRPPAAELGAAMQQHLHQADDAGVVDLDAGILGAADGDRAGPGAATAESPHGRSEHCAWKPAKRSVMARNFSRTASRWSSPFFRPKSARLLTQSSVAQEGGELFVLLDKQRACSRRGRRDGHARVCSSTVCSLPRSRLVHADAEDLGDLVGGQPPQPDLAAALEDFVDRESGA